MSEQQEEEERPQNCAASLGGALCWTKYLCQQQVPPEIYPFKNHSFQIC